MSEPLHMVCGLKFDGAALAEAEVTRLRAELAARKWQPIETAPKDGSEIILGDEHNVSAGFWSEGEDYRRGEDGWFAEMDRGSLLTAKNLYPTHWMPLPTPPAIKEPS